MMITDTATGVPQIKAGKLRALGVSTPKRSPLLPDVPTIDEAGVKGYDMGYWFAAYAPAKHAARRGRAAARAAGRRHAERGREDVLRFDRQRRLCTTTPDELGEVPGRARRRSGAA